MCRVDTPRGTLAAAASASAAASTTSGAVTPFPLHGAVGHESVLPTAMPPQGDCTARAWANPVTGRESGRHTGKDGSRSVAGGVAASPATPDSEIAAAHRAEARLATSPGGRCTPLTAPPEDARQPSPAADATTAGGASALPAGFSAIGAKGGPQFAWTREAEVMAVRMLVEGRPYTEIGLAVGRSPGAVRDKVVQLRKAGVDIPARTPGVKSSWSAADDERLAALYATGLPIQQIATALERPFTTVKTRLTALRTTKAKPDLPYRREDRASPIRRDASWRQHIDTIRDLAVNGYTDSAIADRLGGHITSDMIRAARREAGIPAGVPRNGWGPRVRAKDNRVMRACLGRGCMDKPREQRLFASEGPGHRLCDSCARLREHAA